MIPAPTTPLPLEEFMRKSEDERLRLLAQKIALELNEDETDDEVQRLAAIQHKLIREEVARNRRRP